jgi:hypothetical protein
MHVATDNVQRQKKECLVRFEIASQSVKSTLFAEERDRSNYSRYAADITKALRMTSIFFLYG